MLQKFYEKNRDLLVNINGSLIHRDKAGISPFDSSVQNGDAVWEGLRLYKGKIFRLKEHLARLRRSAAALQYNDFPAEELIIEELRKTLSANDMHDNVHIRLMITRGVKYTSGLDPRVNTAGCTLIILAEHKPPVYDKSGIRLITAAHRRPPADVLDQKIHSANQLTSILAKLEANAAGVDDALMLDINGYVAETNATHVFIVQEGILTTSRTTACPEGITRATVLEIAADTKIPCEVRDITLAEVYRAQEMFCTGTMGEIAPVTHVDGRVIGSGTMGPVTTRINDLLLELTRTTGTQVCS